MFKRLKEVFAPSTPEQTYLNERLRSAAWLGWDAPAAPAPAISLLAVANPSERPEPAAADSLLVDPVAGGKLA